MLTSKSSEQKYCEVCQCLNEFGLPEQGVELTLYVFPSGRLEFVCEMCMSAKPAEFDLRPATELDLIESLTHFAADQ
jgi:hypothetical protein